MKKKLITGLFVVLATGGLLGGGFMAGYQRGIENPKNIIVSGVANMDGKEVSADFKTFWQAWSIINDQYLKNSEVKGTDKVHGAIGGLVASLNDPYSQFFTPETGKKFRDDIRGDFSGIGAEIGIRKDRLLIIAPLKDSPAMKAGLKPLDYILKIGATSTDGLSVEQAVNLIRGPKGSSIVLSILRDTFEKPKEFSIVRDTITLPTVDLVMKDDGIAHIALYSFNANSNRLLYEAINKALQSGAKGMVLDLRNNPGGYLEVAVDIAGWFLEKGTLVVSEAGRNGVNEEFRADGNAALKDFPVVVLMNGGSASASEILAGALHDQRKIKLIGEKSFGKGTVQQLENLSDGSSLKITIAHWVLPSGGILENGGIEPDIKVELTDKDIEAKKDPQLEKAIEVLKSSL